MSKHGQSMSQTLAQMHLNELKMTDPKLNKMFDKLKKGDTVKIKHSSTLERGKDFIEYIVKSKNVVNKGRVEKITLATKDNPTAVKKFLYKRDGKVTFAVGDMGASIDDIKEKYSIINHEIIEDIEVEGLDEKKGDYVITLKGKEVFRSESENDARSSFHKLRKKHGNDVKVTKEEVELDENIPKSTMYALVKDGKVIAKGSKRDMMSKKKKEGGTVYNSPGTKVGDTIKEGVDIQEDGHDDVASAIRQCKTVTEDAMQILQKLQSMSPEGTLPTWWSNKLAIASNSMNKIRDYLLVPSVTEGLELYEKAGDEGDMKKLVGELQNASKLHLAQSKRVKAHVDMMKAGNLKGTLELVRIVDELQKASEAHLRQSKALAKHMEKMNESVIKEQPEHEIQVGGYTTKHFHMCGSAQKVMKKHADKDGAEELTKLQDKFYEIEMMAMNAGKPTDEQISQTKTLYNQIMSKAKEMGIDDEVGDYMKMHMDSMEKGDPKLGFGRTDKDDGKEPIDEGAGKYSKMNLDKAKKLMGPSKNREQGVKMVMKGLGTTYKHANQLVDKILGVNPKTGKIESAELDEAKFSPSMIDKLRKAYEPLKGKKINPTPLMKIFDKIDSNKDGLIQLYKADIPFVSTMAMSRLMQKHNMKSDEINKLKEEVELDEKYDLYHSTFSGAMQHAYDYAKKKMGITVDPKEIDSKVATGPRKPSEGKTNKYRLKGKGGNLQIQVYNKGGSKPFELNMYKEENEMNEKKKLKSGVKFDFRLFDPEDSPGSDKANDDMNKEIQKAVRMKDKETARQYMMKVQKKHSKHGATDTEPREVINQILDAIYEARERFNEKFSITLPPTRGGKKLLNIDMGRAIRMLKDFGATKSDIQHALSGKGGRFQNAGGEMFLVQREGVELGEGYESEVKKVLDKEGIDGYFKNGKLYVSKRDAKDAKKALEDSDEITKLPPMVKEENDMTKNLKETIMDMWKEAVSPAQQAAIAISKKEKEKDEGNAFTGALKAAKEKGEKTFTVAGKVYDVKTEKLVGGQKELDKDNDGDIDGKDFAMLRKQKKNEELENERYRYLETKKGSVREAVLKIWGEISEKVEYVEYKFKNKNDAMAVKKMLDGMQMMNFDVNDDNISNGELMVDAGNRDMTKVHKDIMKKYRPKVMTQEKKDLTKNEKDDSVKKTDTGKEMTPVDMSPKMPKVKESKNKV